MLNPKNIQHSSVSKRWQVKGGRWQVKSGRWQVKGGSLLAGKKWPVADMKMCCHIFGNGHGMQTRKYIGIGGF